MRIRKGSKDVAAYLPHRALFATFAALYLAPLPGCVAHFPASNEAEDATAPLVDHHVHIGSVLIQDHIERVREKAPNAFEHLSEDIFSRPSVADALRLLDEAGVEQIVLLSTAYMFVQSGSEHDPEAEKLMRAENKFSVDTALASNGRIKTFVGINPLAANADDEFAYWQGRPGVSGIKLHLGGAGFEANQPEQVGTLAVFFARARKANMPLIVHLRGGGEYGGAEAKIFIDQVLSQVGDLPVQIAHGAGYAGADPGTIAALTAFGDAIARRAPGTKNLVVDISGVVLPDATAAALGSNDAQLAEFVALMRRIGLDRFVIGSDWPAIGNPSAYFTLMRAKLPVTDAEWAQLCRNRAPYLR
ncbi:amidohydrolase family protein [Sphingosinicella rhizophila]|uniref:Amidohydrolase family protein n=1 Tax=Sphingosinicella rhizophila TaxID=3050082 RepID=A0ABU3QAC6_9SPHN|nr:amidohydrolase family protein [Sphingosinicella sp. GR2756]MDT9600365.1 amidohydrolase family protein [Sphingosinicella sp. GR2756]